MKASIFIGDKANSAIPPPSFQNDIVNGATLFIFRLESVIWSSFLGLNG